MWALLFVSTQAWTCFLLILQCLSNVKVQLCTYLLSGWTKNILFAHHAFGRCFFRGYIARNACTWTRVCFCIKKNQRHPDCCWVGFYPIWFSDWIHWKACMSFKLFISLWLSAVATPLLGMEKCAQGPPYWCQNVKTASICGAVTHCQQNVWNQPQMVGHIPHHTT